MERVTAHLLAWPKFHLLLPEPAHSCHLSSFSGGNVKHCIFVLERDCFIVINIPEFSSTKRSQNYIHIFAPHCSDFRLNCRILGSLIRTRVTSIVFWFVLQRTPPRRNNVDRAFCNCSEIFFPLPFFRPPSLEVQYRDHTPSSFQINCFQALCVA